MNQPIEMQGHIIINYSRVLHEIKTIFLEKIKNNGCFRYKNKNKINKIDNQLKIDEKFESIKINPVKIEMADHVIVKFFACCSIPFYIVDNPFFIDLLYTLCSRYNSSCKQILSEDMLNSEISYVIIEVNLKLSGEEFFTLGWYCNNHFV